MNLLNLTGLVSRLVFTCLILLCTFNSQADDIPKVDSLRVAFDYSENATERIDIQLQIAHHYYNIRSIDTAIFEYHKALNLIPKDSLQQQANVLGYLANAYRKVEDMDNVMKAEKMALNLYQKANANPSKIARKFALVGRTYYDNAQYDSAMTNYMEAKKIYETNEIIDEDYGFLLHFIGSVFKRQGNIDKACEYYHEEIAYGKQHNMKIIEVEGRYLAGVCIEDPRERLNNDLACLEIYTELEKERMMALMYTLIADNYNEMDMLDSALYWEQKCLAAYRELGEISHLSAVLSQLGGMYIKKGDFKEAEKYLKEAEEVALKSGIKKHFRLWDIYQNYFQLNYEKGNYKKAVDYQQLMYAHRDSAQDQEHQDAIQEMEMIYNDEKQKAELAILQKDKDLAEKEKQLAREEAASQSFIKKLFMIGGIIVLLLGVFVFMKYRESQKQKLIISEQKRQMEFQKELVEEKNKDIMDSMTYASSIQQAIITSKEYIGQMFKDFFIFYKPRDIVSGDFYWAYETEGGKKLIAVGDCTGHGVPGAMMSMLGTALLNEIVIEGKTYDPKEVLNKLRDQIKKSLKSDQRRDGMDMSFCCIEKDELTFSGANLPLYVLRGGELLQLKGSKQAIGYQPTEEIPFSNEKIKLQPHDKIYLFSDGYADQFGGPKGKKYKYKTFRERLQQISSTPLNQQQKLIDDEFETWKGDLEQLDDVCVLGFEV